MGARRSADVGNDRICPSSKVGGLEPVVKLGSVLAVGTELAHSKAFGWAKVTAEDLGECIQAFAIAMAELVGVDEVERTGVP